MLGRQVGSSLLRLPRCTRLPIRPLPTQHSQLGLAIRAVAPGALRFYAQTTPSRPGRPKKAVGEPSRPVKRAVKRAAKSPKEGAAAKKVTARKEPAPKKKATKAKTATGRAKKKVPALSEEEKAKQAELLAKRKQRAAARLDKANTAELKKLALSPPHVGRHSANSLFRKEKLTGTGGQFKSSNAAERREAFADQVSKASQEWRNISTAELEHYNHLAHTTKEQELAAYKQYVESHTIEEIEAANKARARLRRQQKGGKSQAKKWPSIRDERAAKRPATPYLMFVTNRWASGDLKNIRVVEASKLISQEWRALSSDEKKKYNNLYQEDRGKYIDEYTSIHGHAPPSVLAEQPAQAAAAAA